MVFSSLLNGVEDPAHWWIFDGLIVLLCILGVWVLTRGSESRRPVGLFLMILGITLLVCRVIPLLMPP